MPVPAHNTNMELKSCRTVEVPAADCTAMFRALAHPTRLGLSPSMVSHHLRELRLANLVRVERRGSWVHCSVNGEALDAIKAFADPPHAG